MKDSVPVPRPGLFTVGDSEAWEEQFHMLFYVLGMSAERIAQIDHGFGPDDAEAWLASPWAREIERLHPFMDARQMIDRCR
jgi:hypothetical protein